MADPEGIHFHQARSGNLVARIYEKGSIYITELVG